MLGKTWVDLKKDHSKFGWKWQSHHHSLLYSKSTAQPLDIGIFRGMFWRISQRRGIEKRICCCRNWGNIPVHLPSPPDNNLLAAVKAPLNLEAHFDSAFDWLWFKINKWNGLIAVVMDALYWISKIWLNLFCLGVALMAQESHVRWWWVGVVYKNTCYEDS